MPCESTNRHRLGKTPSFSLPPTVHSGRRAFLLGNILLGDYSRLRRSNVFTFTGCLQLCVTQNRTSEIRHTDSLLRYFLHVVPTGAVSEVFPDLPQHPSHTPNGQHFEVTTARSATACKGSPVQSACLRRTTTTLRSKGRCFQRLHQPSYFS